MTDCYIFDFGRVLVDFDEPAMTAAYVTDPAWVQPIADIVFDRLYWDRLDEGSITDNEVLSGICNRVPPEFRKAACRAYENWYYHLPIIAGMPEILRELKGNGKKLFLLSNISETFAGHYAQVPELKELLGVFDGLVFSGPIHLIKPDPAIFEFLLQKYGLSAEDCTFVDDNPKNIQAAETLGIQALLFDGNADHLRRKIGLE